MTEGTLPVKRAATALLGLIGIVGLAFFAMGFYSQTGQAPGLVSGQLTPCSTKPNCVNSESAPSDEHSVAAFGINTAMGEDPLQIVKARVEAMGGVVTRMENGYLAATFTSGFFGFVDDLELRHDKNNTVLHVRSSSRVGYSDWGVNRKRVETLRGELSR